MESPASAQRASTPLTNFQADRTLSVAKSVGFGLVFGIGTGLAAGLTVGLTRGLTVGLALGLAGGLFGLLAGGHHAWLAYVSAVRQPAHRGLLPGDLMGFLDDTHRLGLLRAVGPIYQFRHAELQDHFAAGHRLRSS
jgi:hypothetical protein